MVSAAVQELRIVQTLGRLYLCLLDREGPGCGRGAVLKNVTQSHDSHTAQQRDLEFFHSLLRHLLSCLRLPAFDLPDLQVNEQRKKENEDQ